MASDVVEEEDKAHATWSGSVACAAAGCVAWGEGVQVCIVEDAAGSGYAHSLGEEGSDDDDAKGDEGCRDDAGEAVVAVVA